MMTTMTEPDKKVRAALFDALWEKLEGYQDWEVLEGRAGARACVEIDGVFYYAATEFFDEVPEGEKIDAFLEDLCTAALGRICEGRTESDASLLFWQTYHY